MSEMTPRERLMTAFRGGQPDRVPCHLNLTRWIRHHHGCTCPRHKLAAAEEFGLDCIVQYGAYTWQSVSNDYVYTPGGGYSYNASGVYGDLPEVDVDIRVENRETAVWYRRTFHTPAGDLHDVIQWARPDTGYGDGPNPHRVEPLVRGRDDLEALAFLYPPPRRDMIADIRFTLEDAGDRAVVAATDCVHAGSWAMEALGPEQMLISSVEDPDLLKGVCQIANDAHLRNLRPMLEAGLEVVFGSWFQIGPSVGWSPATYADIFLPLVREGIELAHEYDAVYLYQDDGRMRDIIPPLVEAGVDVISGLQPPDIGDVVLREAKEQYGDRVALMGGLDPCYTFDMGSPEAVREAIRRAIADAAEGGGYLIATAEAIDPKTSPDCIHAAARAAREFGTY